MARVILHVGGHKTATSFLQATFHHNAARLAQHGLQYPALPGGGRAHHLLVTPWMDLPDGTRVRDPEAIWDRLIRDHAGHDGTLFLSSEEFVRLLPGCVDLSALAARLAPLGDVRVVYAARRQSSLLPSIWMQIARTVAGPDLPRFIRLGYRDRIAGGVSLDHGAVLDRLATGFAPGSIHVLDYHRIAQAPGGVLQGFLDLAGVPLAAADLVPPPVTETNVSPDPLAFWMATMIHPAGVPPEDLVGIVTAVLDDLLPGRRSLLLRYEHAGIVARFRHANVRFSARVREVQPDFDLVDQPPADDLIFRDDVGAAVWARVGGRLHDRLPVPRRRLGRVLDRLRARTG